MEMDRILDLQGDLQELQENGITTGEEVEALKEELNSLLEID